MTNFDYLKKEKEFDSFVDIAIVAEKTYKIDVSTCIINCRRALEAGIKWDVFSRCRFRCSISGEFAYTNEYTSF